MRGRRAVMVAVATVLGAALASAPALAQPALAPGPLTDISRACPGQNAEVESAADPALGIVYAEWMGCSGAIALARSTDGGRTWSAPIVLPGSQGQHGGSWDPALAVAPNGTVYAAFMTAISDRVSPVVDASFDHGASFPQETVLGAPVAHNWGDRDFIAVAPNGNVDVTWDYGPSAAEVTFICAANGSCSFATGDLNEVFQTSTDGGRTFGPIIPLSPDFPASGSDSGSILVAPDGRIDVLYQGYSYTNRATLTLGAALSYFTSSSDGGHTWSAPVAVGPQAGTMNTSEWWIDGDLSRDGAGNLYATWDTQRSDAHHQIPADTGWLSSSTDGGHTWSAPVQAPPDDQNVPHIMEVAGTQAGTADVAWLSPSDPRGYALYLRPFSIARGWLAPPARIGDIFGEPGVWPGDTFGISPLSPDRLSLAWGSATAATDHDSEIYATTVTGG
jgi:hypothetical protein